MEISGSLIDGKGIVNGFGWNSSSGWRISILSNSLNVSIVQQWLISKDIVGLNTGNGHRSQAQVDLDFLGKFFNCQQFSNQRKWGTKVSIQTRQ